MKIVYNNNTFKLGVYNNEIYFWTEDGMTSLAVVKYNKDTTFSEVYNVLNQCMLDYCNGIIHCSECGEPMQKGKYAGRYFAGVYCQKCWDGKWKEIEANETYD